MLTIPLICHPDAPCTAVQRVAVQVQQLPGDRLSLHYLLIGDMTGIRLPDPQPAHHTDELWRHTCCEAFLTWPGESGYVECNFAPSSAWALYRFSGYRQGQTAITLRQPPLIGLRQQTDRLELEAIVPLTGLTAAVGKTDLQLAIATVIEDVQGGCSYWALHHPPGRPDFHHPTSFALRLAGNKRI